MSDNVSSFFGLSLIRTVSVMTMCRPNTARRLARSLSSCTAMVQAFSSVTAVMQLPKQKYVALVSNRFNCFSTVLFQLLFHCLVLTIAFLTVLFSQLSLDDRAYQLHLSDRCVGLFQYILVLRTPTQVSRHSSCTPRTAEGHKCSSSYCIQRYLPILHTG